MTKQQLREKIDIIAIDMKRDDKPGWIDRNVERLDQIMHLIDEYCKSQKEDDNASDS